MMCIVCGLQSWKYLFDARDRMFGLPGLFREYRCKGCGLVRLDPQPSPKELKKYYPSKKYYSYVRKPRWSFFGSLRSFLIRHKLFAFVPAMPTKEAGRILDIGCGRGDTLALLKSVGWNVYGLDIDAAAISIARKRGLTNVSLGTCQDLTKYPDNFFDIIRLYHVIEHLDEPGMSLRLIYKKLKKGGEVIIGTPNANSLVARLLGRYWYNLDCPRHVYVFSPGNLMTIAERNGFVHHRISFASAGGWVGSIQYCIEDLFSRKIDLINRPWLVILLYPWEWILDRLAIGDIFIYRGKK